FVRWVLPQVGTPAVVPVTELAQRAAGGDRLLSMRVYSTGTPVGGNGFAAYGSRDNASSTNYPQLLLRIAQAAPNVSIISPPDHSVFETTDAIPFSAIAEDSDSAIANVAFYSGVAL